MSADAFSSCFLTASIRVGKQSNRSAQYGSVCVGSQLFGYLTDVYGPKPIMVLVLGADVLFFGLSGVVRKAPLFLACRICAGIFTPMPVGTAWLGKATPEEEKASAFHKQVIAMMCGFISGTAFGAITGTMFGACICSASAALLATAAVAFGAPSKTQVHTVPQQKDAAKHTRQTDPFS